MSDAKAFLHTFLMVLLSIAVYNMFVRNFTPAPVQSWIGL